MKDNAWCCHKNTTFKIWSVYFGSKLLYQYLWVSFRIRFLQYSHTRGSGQFSWSGRVKVWVSGEQVAPILLVAVVLLPLLSLLESSLVLLLVLFSSLLFFEELKLLLTPSCFVLLFILPSPQVIVTLKKEPKSYQAKLKHCQRHYGPRYWLLWPICIFWHAFTDYDRTWVR